jgi:hypothetical protein
MSSYHAGSATRGGEKEGQAGPTRRHLPVSTFIYFHIMFSLPRILTPSSRVAIASDLIVCSVDNLHAACFQSDNLPVRRPGRDPLGSRIPRSGCSHPDLEHSKSTDRMHLARKN